MTVAHQLKYLGHDCIPVGVERNTPETLNLLADWAQHIILTDHTQRIPDLALRNEPKVRTWDIGMDVFPRPFNKTLLAVVRKLVEEHRDEL